MSRILLALAILLPAIPAAAFEAAGVRGSVTIEGDAGFLAPDSGVRSGSGTAEDPFVVSEWTILLTRPWGVRISDTAAHVRVERVHILGPEAAATRYAACVDDPTFCVGSRGVEIENASNVTVVDVDVGMATWGLRARGVERLVVDSFRTDEPWDAPTGATTIAVEVSHARDVRLAALRVAAGSPLFLASAQDVRVERSSFLASEIFEGSGTISLSNVTRLTVVESAFEGVGASITRTSRGLLFADNEFRGGAHAVRTGVASSAEVQDVRICGNRISGQTHPLGAVYLRDARNLTVEGNDFRDVALGFRVSGASADVLIRSNAFRNASERGGVLQAEGISVTGNHFENLGAGITFGAPADARGNWWGDASGPGGDGPGTGVPLLERPGPVAYAPWLTSAPTGLVGC